MPVKKFLFLSLFLLSFALTAHAGFDIGISGDDSGIRGFHFAVGDYYRVPERTVVVIRERRLPDEELPVVFFIAGRARVEPAVIVDLRLRGVSWWDISVRYGLGADVYYLPVRVHPGPPYGKAYGHYKKWPKHKWHKIKLADDDIVNLVNLRFISDYHGLAPERVIELRSGGAGFKTIYVQEEKAKKHKHSGKHDKRGEAKEHQGNGNGNGNGKGKHK